jgi:hypothetical protein
MDKMNSSAEPAAGCDAADGRASGIQREEVDSALLSIVNLKVVKKLRVFAGLFGCFPVFGVGD